MLHKQELYITFSCYETAFARLVKWPKLREEIKDWNKDYKSPGITMADMPLQSKTQNSVAYPSCAVHHVATFLNGILALASGNDGHTKSPIWTGAHELLLPPRADKIGHGADEDKPANNHQNI